MFTHNIPLVFSLLKTEYTDNDCEYLGSQEIVENSCNYTGTACCEEVKKFYNLTFNNCSNKIVYNCTIINPEDEIIIYILFSLCLYCICCGSLYICWFFRKKKHQNNIYERV